MELFIGQHQHDELFTHEGMCLTDDRGVAEVYAGYDEDRVFAVEIDLTALTVEECPGYDRDENEAPADDDDYRAAKAAEGIDVLVYTDEDEQGRQHTCWRLISEKALAAVSTK